MSDKNFDFDHPPTADEFEARLESFVQQFTEDVQIISNSLSDRHIYTLFVNDSDVRPTIVNAISGENVYSQMQNVGHPSNNVVRVGWYHTYTDEFETFINAVEECIQNVDGVTLQISAVQPQQSVTVNGSYNAFEYSDLLIEDKLSDVIESIELNGHVVEDFNVNGGMVEFAVQFESV